MSNEYNENDNYFKSMMYHPFEELIGTLSKINQGVDENINNSSANNSNDVSSENEIALSDTVKNEIENIKPEDVPMVVSSQFSQIVALEEKTKKAMESAEKASEYAKDAKSRAIDAKDKSAGFFHKKAAIEALQDAEYDTASAVVQLSEANSVTVDALTLSLEHQKKLSEITQYLFYLGVSNMAMTETVIRQIELKLKNASKEEISELARQELKNVVERLKAQQDMFTSQQEQGKKIKEQDKRIGAVENKVKDNTDDLDKKSQKDFEQDTRLDEIDAKDREQDRLIGLQIEKDEEHDKRLSSLRQKNEEQDLILTAQKDKDKEHDKRLNAIDEKDKSQDSLLRFQQDKDLEHDERLDKGDEKDREHDLRFEEIERLGQKRDELISINVQNIKHNKEEIDNNLSLIEVNNNSIKSLQEENISLRAKIDELENALNLLNEKSQTLSSKIATNIALGISVVSLIIGIIHFFL